MHIMTIRALQAAVYDLPLGQKAANILRTKCGGNTAACNAVYMTPVKPAMYEKITQSSHTQQDMYERFDVSGMTRPDIRT